MRIAIDARVIELPCPTGVERAAEEIVRAMPRVLAGGDRVLLFSRGELAPSLRKLAGVDALALGGPDAPLVWRESHLAPALTDLGADVLWSPVAAIPLRTSVPRVATVHEVPWLVRKGLEGAFREAAHGIRLRIAAEAAARIVCPSRSAAEQVAASYPAARDRVRIVPHGVPSAFLAPPDPARAARDRRRVGVTEPYLLHVGGTRERKNVPMLLRAYARYLLQGGRAGLVLAGPGDPPERLPRGVRALGYVDDAALLALYDGADALVVSSESEGFGLPVIEAMARGVPVVAAAAGGVPEAAGGAAVLVDAGDEVGLATALRELETEPERSIEAVARGRVRAAACRFEDSARRLFDVLREAASA